MRRLAQISAVVLLALVGIATLVLSTRAGQSGLLRIASAITSDEANGISIGTLEGSLFGAGTLADVTLSDARGPWLVVRGIAFSWTPSALLTGRLDLAHLRVDHIALLRTPETPSGKETPSETSSFSAPLKLAIGAIDLKAIEIAEEIAGERMLLRLEAAADINDLSAASTGKLRLMRLDGAQGALAVDFAYAPDERSLVVSLEGNEPEGGVVAGLLGLPPRLPMAVHLHGRGTLEAWQADLSLAASGNPFVAGTLRLDAAGDQVHRLSGELAGFVEPLVPRAAADIFSGKSEVILAADFSGLGDGALRAIRHARVDIRSAAMRIAAAGSVDLSRGFMHGGIEGRIAHEDGRPVTFGGEAPPSVREMTFRATLPETQGARRMTAVVELGGIVHPQFGTERLVLSAEARQPDPAGPRRSVIEDINVRIEAVGVDEATAFGAALGSAPRATLRASYDGVRLDMRALDVGAKGAQGHLTGTLEGGRITGTARLDLSDLAPYAALAERPLQGQLAIDAKIDGDVTAQTFVGSLVAESAGLAAGLEAIDGLLKPATKHGVRVERAADGTLSVHEIALTNENLALSLHGKRSRGALDVTGDLRLLSLAAAHPDLAGAARLDVAIKGTDDDLTSRLRLSGEAVMLNGKPLEEPVLSFAGRGPLTRHAGKLAMSGKIAGEVLSGRADVAVGQAGDIAITDMAFEVAGARLDGAIERPSAGLPSGRFKLDGRDLARLGKALGVRLQGRIRSDVTLAAEGSGRRAKLNLEADNLVLGDLRIASVRSVGDVADDLDVPTGSLNLRISGVAQGARALGGLSLEARLADGAASFRSQGRIDNGAFDLSGTIKEADGAQAIEIATLSYTGRKDAPSIRLSAPARLLLREGKLTVPAVRIAVGDGALRLNGVAAAEKLDMTATLERIPAALAGLAAPDLGIAGSISGTATVKGVPGNPQIAARIAASGLSVDEMRTRQLPSADINTQITATDGQAQLKMNLKARGGVDLSLDGTIDYGTSHTLALTGSGTLPLALASVFLADRATRIAGAATMGVEVVGPLAEPRVAGHVSIQGATLSDPEVGLDLTGITADVAFARDGATVRRLTAASKKGGTINAEGTVRLGQGGAPTVDGAIRLTAFKFGNQDPVAAEINSDVRISGPIQALIARGEVHIARMDITVPNRMPQSVSALDIRHVNAPARFQLPDGKGAAAPASSSDGPSVSLALDVRASDRIFVRGRGVDAQLGGAIKVLGTSAQPFTDGQFTMSRGRLALLGRQLDFSRGNIVFTGSPEPSLDLEAQADADGTIVTVRVSGPASKPKLEFTSSPPLPEDEIVSLLLFNKQLATLSPSQVVQLASEIDKIGGFSSGPGAFDKMKSALGIDVLDFSTDEQGRAQATAGSYISDKTYVGVKQGMSLGQSRIVIDHEITKNLKARGEVGTDGTSKLGLGVEWSY